MAMDQLLLLNKLLWRALIEMSAVEVIPVVIMKFLVLRDCMKKGWVWSSCFTRKTAKCFYLPVVVQSHLLTCRCSDLLLPMSECRFTLQNEFSEIRSTLPPHVLSSCGLSSHSLSFILKKTDGRLITGLPPSCFRSTGQGRYTGKRHPVR